jgi:hypothetical protein
MQNPNGQRNMLPVQNLHKRRPVRRKQSVNVNTSDIEVSPVNLSQPSLNNSIVDLIGNDIKDIIHIMKLKFETIPLVLEEDTKSSNWQ